MPGPLTRGRPSFTLFAVQNRSMRAHSVRSWAFVTRPPVRPVVVLLGMLAVAGCDDRLPMAPTDLTSGVAIYVHANYQGESAQLTSDVPDLRDYRGPCRDGDPQGGSGDPNWNECISSIRVAPGWAATIYTDDDYRGESLTVSENVPNLQLVPGTCSHDGLNDCITSIRVFRP